MVSVRCKEMSGIQQEDGSAQETRESWIDLRERVYSGKE